MPRIPNYYIKHKGKWVTEYNPCLSAKLPLNVSTVSFFSRIESAAKIIKNIGYSQIRIFPCGVLQSIEHTTVSKHQSCIIQLGSRPAYDVESTWNLPVPDPKGAVQHLILVKAVAFTNGELKWPEPASCSPAIPGYEVSGTVISAPPGSRFPVGSEIYARTSFQRQENARQCSIALAGEMGHKPKNLSWSQAATVPLSGLTAWQALFVHGDFEPPGGGSGKNGTRKILVTAAAGGVGIWAIQLARLAGIGVFIATCGPANIAFVQSLGAHEALNYTTHADLSTWIESRGGEKFDVVLDCVGEVGLEQSWMAVKEGGLLISIAMLPDSQKLRRTLA